MAKSHIYLLIVFLSYLLYESFAESQESLDRKFNETQEKLNLIEDQQKVLLDNLSKLEKSLEQKETSWKNLIPSDFETKIDRIEKLLEALQQKSENKSVSPLFQRIGCKLIYIEHRGYQTWTSAEEHCRQMGGHLATIQNDYDFNAINSQLEESISYWLGVSDIAKEGEFVSIASGKRSPFFKWKAGQPNNLENNENCVDIYKGHMYDSNCDEEQSFICEAHGYGKNQSLKSVCPNKLLAMAKSHIFLLIVFLSYHLYESFAERRESGQSVCLLHDPPNQCGEFCLTALKPMLDHIAFHQKEWSTCDQQKLNETQDRINRIEDQQKVLLDNLSKLDKSLEQKESSWKNLIPSDLETKIDRIEKLLEDLQEKFDKKSVSPLFQRIGSRLIYIENKVHQSWHGAEESCRQMGGHLATIQNDYDFNAINSQLEKSVSYWLGVSDIAKEGEFVSVASGKRAPFFKWKAGQPNNIEGKDNCVDIYNGYMFDSNCDEEEVYICEADV
ncbi:uncharacterized protein LOC108108426 [Drosophila eugracilis]|uniref:uncharacterized protein LOC108108426 n=1 Tax=Drosophila eugracilis TaxID=29029 RepID=UPI0007E6F887|nr:uncharacterized protein LOC108108426 [Drosophila eugracilis]